MSCHANAIHRYLLKFLRIKNHFFSLFDNLSFLKTYSLSLYNVALCLFFKLIYHVILNFDRTSLMRVLRYLLLNMNEKINDYLFIYFKILSSQIRELISIFTKTPKAEIVVCLLISLQVNPNFHFTLILISSGEYIFEQNFFDCIHRRWTFRNVSNRKFVLLIKNILCYIPA